MTRMQLINALIEKFNYHRYLEIGVAWGDCFKEIKADFKFGVDPADQIKTMRFENSYFFHGISEEFFNKINPEPFDIIFIDGWHTHEMSLYDVEHALQILSENGTIILHDCVPPEEDCQTPLPTGSAWYGQVWKTIVKLRQRDDLQIQVVNTDCGLGIIRLGKSEPLIIPETELTWANFVQYKTTWLNLVESTSLCE